jgi:hypothetical protein
MNIKVHETVCLRMAPTREFDYAAHLDDYDGAPDAGKVGNWIGYGPTPQAAATDLWEQIADYIEERLAEGKCHD